MRHCKLVCGQLYDHDFEQEIEIPDGVYFYKTSSIGRGTKIGASHYCTVLKTEDYMEWIKYLNNKRVRNWSVDSLGEYTIVTIIIVYDDKHELPIKTKEEVLSTINFHKYVFAYYDKNYRCINVRRIFDFDSIFELKVGYILLYDPFNRIELESISTVVCRLSDLIINDFDIIYQEYKTFEGNEAEVLWNSAINKVISHNFNYDAFKVDQEYKFQPKYDEFITKYGKTRMEYFDEIRFQRLEGLERILKNKE